MKNSTGRIWVVILGLTWALAADAAAPTAAPTEATEFTVDGIKVIVQPRPASGTVAAGIFFRGGRLNLTTANAGQEALLFASAIEGSERFPRDTLRAELARMASVIDYRCFDDYSVVSLRCTTAAFARTLAIVGDAALHPALDPADVERVRTRLIATASAESDIDLVRRRKFEAAIYRGHPYEPSTEGTPETLRAVTLDALRTHHRRLAQKSRMLVVVAGGVDEAQVRAALGAMFAALPEGGPPAGLPPPLNFAGPGFRRAALDLSVPRADILFAGPPPDAPDWPALRMAASILQNRIFEVVRDREALSYDPSVELEAHAAAHGSIRLSSSNLDEAARLIADQVARLRREAVPPTLLAATAAQLRATELTEAQRNDAQIGRLAEYELLRGGWRKSFGNPYEAVTAPQLQEAAQRYLAKLQYFVLGPASVHLDEKVFAR